MASLSLTQRWLKDNCQSYNAPPRVYADIDAALARFTTLRPKSDVYTFDDGRTQLLLCIHGLLPITFRQSSYNIPIAVWITRDYPRSPPIAYVVPTADMLVKAGKHVDPSGRCSIDYISNWQRKDEGCHLSALLDALQQHFSQDPPVYAKPKDPYAARPPPPLPAPNPPASTSTSPPNPSDPPALPTKPAFLHPQGPNPSPANTVASSSVHPAPAPPPPRPPHPNPNPLGYSYPPHFSPVNQAPTFSQSPSSDPLPPAHYLTQNSPPQRSPASPPPPPIPYQAQFAPQSNQPTYVGPPATYTIPNYQPPPPRTEPLPPRPAPPFPQQPSHHPTPIPDLLDQDDASLGDTLGTARSLSPAGSGPNSSGVPAPPRPPNPELQRLHTAVHQKLTAEINQLSQALAADAERLRAQQADLLAGEPAIHDEMARLEAVRDVCRGVVGRMKGAVERAEANVGELKRKGDPEVDELVCATSIVHNQLTNLVADDNAIEDTIYHLHRALNAGRIDLERFLRSTRMLAEEQFMKRALIEKIQNSVAGLTPLTPSAWA